MDMKAAFREMMESKRVWWMDREDPFDTAPLKADLEYTFGQWGIRLLRIVRESDMLIIHSVWEGEGCETKTLWRRTGPALFWWEVIFKENEND